jgi:CheY-like chemotaxis protein
MKINKILPSIVLIDDDEVDIMNFERAMRHLAVVNKFHIFRNGEEARRAILDKDGSISKPFALIVDLNMPKMGGHELIEALGTKSELNGIPVFVFTTSDAEKDKKDAWELKVNGYFLKEMSQNGYSQTLKVIVDFINSSEIPQ